MCESPSSCHMLRVILISLSSYGTLKLDNKTSASIDTTQEQEDNCKPSAGVMSVSDSIGSNEFADSSDTALKLLLDFPGGNGMEFIRENFLGSGCD
ncbi:hypothetical protein OIU78_030387 [Salix suchowensis]|nr:hypothetical protein OIU78_030387 [Salix suchowensis]